MAIIKVNGFVVGIVKASELDIKKVEANGFVVVLKQRTTQKTGTEQNKKSRKHNKQTNKKINKKSIDKYTKV